MSKWSLIEGKYTGHWGVKADDREGFCSYTKEQATLMAAAPELLDALDKAYTQILEFLNEGEFKQEVVWDAGYIIDALAKAKGEP